MWGVMDVTYYITWKFGWRVFRDTLLVKIYYDIDVMYAVCQQPFSRKHSRNLFDALAK